MFDIQYTGFTMERYVGKLRQEPSFYNFPGHDAHLIIEYYILQPEYFLSNPMGQHSRYGLQLEIWVCGKMTPNYFWTTVLPDS